MQEQLTLFATAKRCNDCGEMKPLGGFNRWRLSGDGHASYCRECTRARHRDYRARNLELVRARNREYERQNRAQARERYQQWADQNREYVRESNRAFRHANPERATEYSRRYRYAHPEARGRSRDRKMRAIDEDSAAYVEITRRDPCAYCGEAGGTIDHIVPLKSDGANHWQNFTGACLACNGGKRDRPLLDFLLRRLP